MVSLQSSLALQKLDARPEDVVLQLGDGTLVSSEEYFAQLEPQSLLVWSREGQVAQTGTCVRIHNLNRAILSNARAFCFEQTPSCCTSRFGR